MQKQQKEKKMKTTKKIKGHFHVCQFGPTTDARFEKCWFCPNIRVKK